MARQRRQQQLDTIVSFILDKSGSMDSVKRATISGFNEYIGTLKRSGDQIKFTLTTFDTAVEKRLNNVPVADVADLTEETYRPDGGTALYDAVCSTITEVQKVITNEQKSIVIIMTDGQENSSREYTEVQLKEKIDTLTKTGLWTFVFLGANQDAWATAQRFGVAVGNTATYTSTSDGTQAAFRTMAVNTANFVSMTTNSTSAFFSQADKDKLLAVDDESKANKTGIK